MRRFKVKKHITLLLISYLMLIFLSSCGNNTENSSNEIKIYKEEGTQEIGAIDDAMDTEDINQKDILTTEDEKLSNKPVHYDTEYIMTENDSIRLRDMWFDGLTDAQIEDIKNKIMELHMDIEYDLVYIFTSDYGPESAKWNNIDGTNSDVIDEYTGHDMIYNLEYTKDLINDELYTEYVDNIIEKINYIIVNHDIDIYYKIHQEVHDLSYYVINYPLETFEIEPPDWHGIYVYFGSLDNILKLIRA